MDDTADGSGVTTAFELFPHVPAGILANAPVTLSKPASFDVGSSQAPITEGMSFLGSEEDPRGVAAAKFRRQLDRLDGGLRRTISPDPTRNGIGWEGGSCRVQPAHLCLLSDLIYRIVIEVSVIRLYFSTEMRHPDGRHAHR